MDYKETQIIFWYRFGVSEMFLNVFEKSLMLTKAAFFLNQKHSKNANIVKYR